jgi:tRNA threonylcarbamoyladenosine biosynthesis protein TsaB
MVICLETATNICSAALCDDTGVRYLRESTDSKSHAALLTLYIEELINEAGIGIKDLDAVAVSKGPGSYTGLRIGVSVAKGIAYGASKPLIAIDTTLSMFRTALDSKELPPQWEDALFCPMIDARRQEVYYAIYNSKGDIVKNVAAEIINSETFKIIPKSKKIILFGDGAAKCKTLIKRENLFFPGDFRVSATGMHIPVIQALNEKKFEDVAYFEPFYLKDFIATKPGKNILGT